MGDKEYNDIKSICKEYGYGNVMALASALWIRELKNLGVPIDIAFVAVPPLFIKKRFLKVAQESSDLYEKIIEVKESKND